MESQVLVAAPLRIGEVATRSGLTVKTIRFYCDEGLIHPISRSPGGYRLLGDEVFAELALIRTLKTMDIPLEDVTRILKSRRSGLCTFASLGHNPQQSRWDRAEDRRLRPPGSRAERLSSVAGKTAAVANLQRPETPYHWRYHCSI
jgi:DNA-binding transcriptional MerR regulator